MVSDCRTLFGEQQDSSQSGVTTRGNGGQETKKSEKSEEKVKISYKAQHDGRRESRIQG